MGQGISDVPQRAEGSVVNKPFGQRVGGPQPQTVVLGKAVDKG